MLQPGRRFLLSLGETAGGSCNKRVWKNGLYLVVYATLILFFFSLLSAARFVTPDQKYVADNTPHTPTPFKNALEKYGPIRPLVCNRQVCGSLLAVPCSRDMW